MSFKKSRDLILGVLMLLLSLVYLFFAIQIKTRPLLTPDYASARHIPIILGGILAALSVICIVQGVCKLKAADTDKKSESEKGDVLAVSLTFVLIIGYTFIMQILGFILSTIIYLFLQMLILAPKEKRNYLLFVIVALIFTAIVFIAFRIGLQQLLPRGIIERLLGF